MYFKISTCIIRTHFLFSYSRCPQYPNIGPSCMMVVDPQDPVCCKIPQCSQGPNTAVPTGVVGVVTGSGLPPAAGPTPTPGVGGSTMFPPLFTLTPTPGPGVSPKPRGEYCSVTKARFTYGRRASNTKGVPII